MKIIERKLKGVYEINLNPIKDNRGFFMRTYDNEFLNDYIGNINWVRQIHQRF